MQLLVAHHIRALRQPVQNIKREWGTIAETRQIERERKEKKE